MKKSEGYMEEVVGVWVTDGVGWIVPTDDEGLSGSEREVSGTRSSSQGRPGPREIMGRESLFDGRWAGTNFGKERRGSPVLAYEVF